MNVVIDTNVIVSAIYSPSGKPAKILIDVLSGKLKIFHNFQIIEEYEEVLNRSKFGFDESCINAFLEPIKKDGYSVIPPSLSQFLFVDESDRKFFEVAKFCNALLITGNIKHFPKDPCVISVSDFYQKYYLNELD